MKRTILLCTVSLFLAGPADAQGFISKMTKAVKKTVQTLQGSEEEEKKEEKKEQNGNEQSKSSQTNSKGPTIFMPKSNLYSLDYEECKKKFANFKKTDSTQIIQLDNLKGIKLGYFNNNRAFVHTANNSILCIDERGNLLKRLKIHAITEDSKFNSNRIICEEGYSEATIYDNYFKPVKKLQNCTAFTNFADGVAMITTKTQNKNFTVSDKTYYIDINGNPKFNQITSSDHALKTDVNRSLHDGIAAFRVYNSKDSQHYWGFRDANGKIITPAKYIYVQDFSEGMAAVAAFNVEKILKWGFIDKTGKEVIPLQYTKQPTMFDSCGLAMVTNKDGQNLFIDKTGKIVSEAFGGSADRITPFCNGKAILISKNFSILTGVMGEEKAPKDPEHIHYLVDSTFNKLCILDYHDYPRHGLMLEIPSYSDSGMLAYGERSGYEVKQRTFADQYSFDGPAFFIQNHRMYIRIQKVVGGDNLGYGLLSADGDLVIAGLAGGFQEGLAPVYDESLGVGYVNEKGEWVVKFEKNEF